MKATIYHNPNCSTSRKALDILRAEGADVEIVEYLKSPPSKAQLQKIYADAGISPREGLRSKEKLAGELGLGETSSEQEILDAMMAHPVLINRPLVVTDKGARLCRPQDKVREIL